MRSQDRASALRGKNVESKLSQSRGAIMTIDASPKVSFKRELLYKCPLYFWAQCLHYMVFLSHFLNNVVALSKKNNFLDFPLYQAWCVSE